MRDFWIHISIPSPAPSDIIIERDHNGKCVKIDGEYKKVRKMFYVEYDYEVFDRWKSENIELIEEQLQGRKGKMCLNTFKS